MKQDQQCSDLNHDRSGKITPHYRRLVDSSSPLQRGYSENPRDMHVLGQLIRVQFQLCVQRQGGLRL